MSRRTPLVGLIAAALLAVAIRPLIAGALTEPLGLLYGVVARFVESLPQIYLWAALVGAAALIGLRRVPWRAPERPEPLPSAPARRGRVGSWAQTLADRRRGAYFEWRLANRLADLASWIGVMHHSDAETQLYLDLGRNRQTIKAGRDLMGLKVNLERLVGYLEDALDRN